MRHPTLVQLSDELLAELDDRAAAVGRSRSALIREAISSYLGLDERQRVDAAIVDGYRRRPEKEDRAAVVALRDSIAEEPW